MNKMLAISILMALILLSIIPLDVVSLSSFPSSAPTIVRNITIPTSLSYILINKVSAKNSTSLQISYINYTVLNISGSTIYVKVTTNASKNYTFILIQNDTYKVNIITNLLWNTYPYILPYYLYNSTYGLIALNESLLLSFYASHENNTVYEYFIHNNHFNGFANISSLGYLIKLNETSPFTFTFTLVSAKNFTNITLDFQENSNEISLAHPYLYSVYNYSSLAGGVLPEGWAEIVYPLLVGNYVVQAEYKLLPRSGEELLQLTPFSVGEAYYVLVIGNQSSIPLTYITNPGASQIIWDKGIFNLYESNSSIYIYKNISSTGVIISYLYVNSKGEMLELKSIGNLTGTVVYAEYLISTNYLPPNTTYPQINTYFNSTLPFKAINPRLALNLTIVIVFLIVFIIIILRREY